MIHVDTAKPYTTNIKGYYLYLHFINIISNYGKFGLALFYDSKFCILIYPSQWIQARVIMYFQSNLTIYFSMRLSREHELNRASTLVFLIWRLIWKSFIISCLCIFNFRRYFDVYNHCMLLYHHRICVFLLLGCHYCVWTLRYILKCNLGK